MEQGECMAGRQSHFDPDDSSFLDIVRLIIDRHSQNATEADIRAAVGRFLVFTGLASEEDLQREREWIDLQSSDLLIETKRRIGTKSGFTPNPAYIEQLDRYMLESVEAGRSQRLGILTDGRYWLIRIIGMKEIITEHPYGFVLNSVNEGLLLYEWLRDALITGKQPLFYPSAEEVSYRLGSGLHFERDMTTLNSLYEIHKDDPSLRVKRDLWSDLLAAALGEVVEEDLSLDQLFLRHTYLSTVVGLAVQSAFGINIRAEAAPNPEGLLAGQVFVSETGIRGVVESDFFAWPGEIEESIDWVVDLASRVAAFDWGAAEYDIARVLYQAVIPNEERKRLGEYYTPDWLAKAVIEEVVPEPLDKRILDPACGSGTFLGAAIRLYTTSALDKGWNSKLILDRLSQSIIGIDVHPVSVHLARATWVLAARDVIIDSGVEGGITIPVYLGDSLQLRTNNGNLLGENLVTIEVAASREGERHRLLQFPRSLVDQGDWFDDTMLRIAEDVGGGGTGKRALDDAGIPHDSDRDILEETVEELAELHSKGRNHIWAYYTRNLVRPIWLSTEEGRVDAIVGNPPWITYSRTHSSLRDALESQSKDVYRIWQGGRFAPHQDIAGLFYTRCVDLYLKRGGRIGMVMPHSALQLGQYSKWRKGEWSITEADMNSITPWDLEKIEPNTFFPVPSCVVFAIKTDDNYRAAPLGNRALRWRGPQGGPFVLEEYELQDPTKQFASAYGNRAFQGATVTPRVLFFVEVSEASAALVSGICRVTPRRSVNEKEPWKNLSVSQIRYLSGPIERRHVYPIHLGETVAPFILLEPLQVVLPMESKELGVILSKQKEDNIGGVDPTTLGTRMRKRWGIMCDLWDENKGTNSNLNLIERIDYMKNLTSQSREAAIRLVYTTSGRPTAAVLSDPAVIIDTKLYWVKCSTIEEGHYLAALINSQALRNEVEALMGKGTFGARDLHKHLWRLQIPEYDDTPILVELAGLGKYLQMQSTSKWEELKSEREAAGKSVSWRAARKELRAWLASSPEARRVETLAERILPPPA